MTAHHHPDGLVLFPTTELSLGRLGAPGEGGVPVTPGARLVPVSLDPIHGEDTAGVDEFVPVRGVDIGPWDIREYPGDDSGARRAVEEIIETRSLRLRAPEGTRWIPQQAQAREDGGVSVVTGCLEVPVTVSAPGAEGVGPVVRVGVNLFADPDPGHGVNYWESELLSVTEDYLGTVNELHEMEGGLVVRRGVWGRELHGMTMTEEGPEAFCILAAGGPGWLLRLTGHELLSEEGWAGPHGGVEGAEGADGADLGVSGEDWVGVRVFGEMGYGDHEDPALAGTGASMTPMTPVAPAVQPATPGTTETAFGHRVVEVVREIMAEAVVTVPETAWEGLDTGALLPLDHEDDDLRLG